MDCFFFFLPLPENDGNKVGLVDGEVVGLSDGTVDDEIVGLFVTPIVGI